jgi:hypothetical protein
MAPAQERRHHLSEMQIKELGEAMTRTLFVAFSLVAATASAQTVERQFSVSVDWGIFAVKPVEADGDLATSEWLVIRPPQFGPLTNLHQFKVVAERDGRTCEGEWFRIPNNGGRRALDWVRVGNKDMIQGSDYDPQGRFRVTLTGFDVPAC